MKVATKATTSSKDGNGLVRTDFLQNAAHMACGLGSLQNSSVNTALLQLMSMGVKTYRAWP